MAFSSISVLWNKWNIRSFVLLSLLLQVFLILFSPIRKKTANDRIIFLLWLAYLMADWVAIYAIGLISHNQGNLCVHATEVDGALQAFWASFLLLHLGGPDTITAFSLEDSSLWGRHLLSLIFQIGAAIYVFAQIFPSDKSLIIPTMLVFLVGVIKNAERTLALYLSSLPRLKEWVHKKVNNLRAPQVEQLSSTDYDGDRAIDHSEDYQATPCHCGAVGPAYYFFEKFKVFLGSLMFTRREREISCIYFTTKHPLVTLTVMSIELQFIYEVLHTKTLAIRSKLSYIFRFINFMAVVVAFVLFNRLKKHQLSKLDVEITYILLFGGIVLDVIALFMLIFSDWTLVKIIYNYGSSELYSLMFKLAYSINSLRQPWLATCKAEPHANVSYHALDTPIIFRRWSESISACNLLSMTLKESPKKMYKCDLSLGRIASSKLFDFPFHMVEKIISYFHQAGETIAKGCSLGTTQGNIAMIANTKYVSKNPFLMELWYFIIEEMKRKSKSISELTEVTRDSRNMDELNMVELTQVKKIFEARGDLFLKSLSDGTNYDDLLEDVTKVNYDDSIIMWHIATEILYNREQSTEDICEKEFSKILSDYMLYLFLKQPNVVSAVADLAQITMEKTFNDLQKVPQLREATRDVKWLCNQLFEDSRGLLLKPQRKESMLKPGSNLARKIERLGERKWKVMSGVWVEMLSYAAIHIKGEAHVQVLSKGGELLTFIWLLMAHFGFVYKPELGIYYERRDE